MAHTDDAEMIFALFDAVCRQGDLVGMAYGAGAIFAVLRRLGYRILAHEVPPAPEDHWRQRADRALASAEGIHGPLAREPYGMHRRLVPPD